MAIVDYQSLQAAVADEMHRLDMAARIPLFIATAHTEICSWVKEWSWGQVTDADGLTCWSRIPYILAPLVNPSDSNDVIAQFPDAYLYGAVTRGLLFTRDYQAAAAYQQLFQAELSLIASSDIGLDDGFEARPSTRLRHFPRVNGALSFDEGL